MCVTETNDRSKAGHSYERDSVRQIRLDNVSGCV